MKPIAATTVYGLRFSCFQKTWHPGKMSPEVTKPIAAATVCDVRFSCFQKRCSLRCGLNFEGDAGWSSPVARRAHNPKVAGSNPAPATIKYRPFLKKGADLFPPFPRPADLLKDRPKTVQATILSGSPIGHTLNTSANDKAARSRANLDERLHSACGTKGLHFELRSIPGNQD